MLVWQQTLKTRRTQCFFVQPMATPPWGALLPITFPDFTSPCQLPGSGKTWTCMPRRLEVTSTNIHITVHTWVLTREDRKCGASAPPAAFHHFSVLPRLLRLPLVGSVGEESSLSAQASRLCWPLTPWHFTHLDTTVCSCRQDGRNVFPWHGSKLEKSVQSFLD